MLFIMIKLCYAVNILAVSRLNFTVWGEVIRHSGSYYSDRDSPVNVFSIRLCWWHTFTLLCAAVSPFRLWKPCSPAAAQVLEGKADGSPQRTWRPICMQSHSQEPWLEPWTTTGMFSGGEQVTHSKDKMIMFILHRDLDVGGVVDLFLSFAEVKSSRVPIKKFHLSKSPWLERLCMLLFNAAPSTVRTLKWKHCTCPSVKAAVLSNMSIYTISLPHTGLIGTLQIKGCIGARLSDMWTAHAWPSTPSAPFSSNELSQNSFYMIT